MRCKVLKGTVDGVAKGGIVELADNLANRALILGGELEALDLLPQEPPPKAFRPGSQGDHREAEQLRARFDASWREVQEELAKLRTENSTLRARVAELEAAAAPAPPAAPSDVSGEAPAKGKKPKADPDAPKVEG